jgi:hypothetical protein
MKIYVAECPHCGKACLADESHKSCSVVFCSKCQKVLKLDEEHNWQELVTKPKPEEK